MNLNQMLAMGIGPDRPCIFLVERQKDATRSRRWGDPDQSTRRTGCYGPPSREALKGSGTKMLLGQSHAAGAQDAAGLGKCRVTRARQATARPPKRTKI